MADLTMITEVVVKVQDPPVTVFMKESQCQMTVVHIIILVLPQKKQGSWCAGWFQFLSSFSGERLYNDPDALGAFIHVGERPRLDPGELLQGWSLCQVTWTVLFALARSVHPSTPQVVAKLF